MDENFEEEIPERNTLINARRPLINDMIKLANS